MIKLTPSQSLGNKGEQWFPAQLPEYWHFQKPSIDLGIDGVVVIAEQNSLNGMEFRVQIKSSKDWKKKGNEIVLRGIKRNTARTWASGATPTLLVFYDDSKKQGYCAWALDAMPPIPELLFGRSSTITLKAKNPFSINNDCWNSIRSSLKADAELKIKALNTGAIANIVFPKINEITKSIRFLQLYQFAADSDPRKIAIQLKAYHCRKCNDELNDLEIQMLLSLAQASAHRDIILSILKVLLYLDPKCIFATKLQHSVETYKNKIAKCYEGFDAMLSDPNKAAIVFENQEMVKTLRPEMIQHAAFLLQILSCLGAEDTEEQLIESGKFYLVR
jgi:hypothetical protein